MHSLLTILAVLVPLTTAQNLGDPALLSSYPACAQECGAETSVSPVSCGATDLECMCSPTYRAATAACERVSCSPADYDKTQTLASQLCGSLYSNGTVNPTSVSAAISSSTAVAAAAVASKDPTNPASYPPCAQACISQYLPPSGCGSLANRACVCQGPYFNLYIGTCEMNSCSKADLATISYLAYELCNPIGGIGNTSTLVNQTIASQTASAGSPMAPTESPQPFTGGAASMQAAWALFSGVLVAMVGFVILV